MEVKKSQLIGFTSLSYFLFQPINNQSFFFIPANLSLITFTFLRIQMAIFRNFQKKVYLKYTNKGVKSGQQTKSKDD